MKSLSAKDILIKLMRYCAYQERCTSEVVEKMKSLGADPDWFDEIIDHLQSDGYLDDTRFAQIYARSKFNQLRWGKLKISRGLKHKGVSNEDINVGLREIVLSDYHNTLKDLIAKKRRELKGVGELQLRQKIVRYAVQKGYETGLVYAILNDNNN